MLRSLGVLRAGWRNNFWGWATEQLRGADWFILCISFLHFTRSHPPLQVLVFCLSIELVNLHLFLRDLWVRGKKVNANKLRYKDGGLESSGERFKLKINLDFWGFSRNWSKAAFLIRLSFLSLNQHCYECGIKSNTSTQYSRLVIKYFQWRNRENFLWVVAFGSRFICNLHSLVCYGNASLLI